MKLDSIIFDLDGTLWDSTSSVIDSWNNTLNNYNEIKRKLSIEDMKSVMGLVIEDVAAKLFPYLNSELRLMITKDCCKYECEHLKKNGAVLYEQLEKTLISLNKKYKLYIVSNCQDGYIESFLHYHKLSKYFLDYECSGRSGLPKGENIKLIIERNNLSKSIYIGDTKGDAEASKVAKVPFIYASYGFGEVDNFDYKIDEFKEILEIVEKISYI